MTINVLESFVLSVIPSENGYMANPSSRKIAIKSGLRSYFRGNLTIAIFPFKFIHCQSPLKECVMHRIFRSPTFFLQLHAVMTLLTFFITTGDKRLISQSDCYISF